MDEILILILGILWAAFSFYQSNKKKKEKAEQAGKYSQTGTSNSQQAYYDDGGEDIKEQAKNKGLVDTIFDVMEGEEQENKSFSDEQENEMTDEDISRDEATSEAEEQKKPKRQEQKREDKKQIQKVRKNRNHYRIQKKSKQKMVRNIAHDFDGKKGVIYSEIMKRPYQ